VYLAPLGLWLTLDAGTFEAVEISDSLVRLTLAAATPHTPAARLRVEQPAASETVGLIAPTAALPVERGAYVIPLRTDATHVTLRTSRLRERTPR
jgi:type IV secretory pathway protease TraF